VAAVSALSAIVQIGEPLPLGGGLQPRVIAHWYEGGLSRILAYELGEDGTMSRVPGAYAPALEAEVAYPVTDILLAIARDNSAVAQRLDTLDTKAIANHGASFREKVFESQVAWGSDGYGRHFEARSQLESHPYDGQILAGVTPTASAAVSRCLRENLERIDGETRWLEAPA
jgi:hypothetical protein